MPCGTPDAGTLTVEEFLGSAGLNAEDFSSARQYLIEEQGVLFAPHVGATGGPGAPISFAFSSAPENPGSPARARLHTDSFLRDTADPLDEAFAQRGATQAFMYFRDAAREGAKRATWLPTPLSKALSNIAAVADGIVGKYTVREDYDNCCRHAFLMTA